MTAQPAPPRRRATPLANVRAAAVCQQDVRLGQGCVRLAPEVLRQFFTLLRVCTHHTSINYHFVRRSKHRLVVNVDTRTLLTFPVKVVELSLSFFMG